MTDKKELTEMDTTMFVEAGLLQEINRLFLHPLGMALSVDVEDDGKYVMSSVLITDDKAGIVFSDEIIDSTRFQRKCESLDKLRDEAKVHRMAKYGYFVQPRFKQ